MFGKDAGAFRRNRLTVAFSGTHRGTSACSPMRQTAEDSNIIHYDCDCEYDMSDNHQSGSQHMRSDVHKH